MAMCGNYIQRVKIVINNNIIEQVTDFKYLGYRISEYKSDSEDKLKTYNKINGAKLKTYNKINGAIWRHFGKQMNKETKLRIHITAIAAMKFGSEAWVLKKIQERLEAVQMKFLHSKTLPTLNKVIIKCTIHYIVHLQCTLPLSLSLSLSLSRMYDSKGF